jgi:hypothetical protein
MGKHKKICLFIVEGISDQTSLAVPLQGLLQDNMDIQFRITHGDITSKNHICPQTILSEIGKTVTAYLKKEKLKKTDLIAIIQIVDMDGAYIAPENIKKVESTFPFQSLPYYQLESIQAENVENIIQRNNKKAANLNRIRFNRQILGNVPYYVYYFSCNMDHVFQADANLLNHKKVDLAYKFAEKYENNPEGFKNLLVEAYPDAISEDYQDSWEFIEQDNHSLERWSNFVLFLKTSLIMGK